MYSFQTIALRSLAFLMLYCYFFMFLSLIVIPITILIMFTIDYVVPIILPNITTNNCSLNLFECFSMVYTRVKLSLIVMYSLTTVNVYELVRFKISSVVHGGHNITSSASFLVSCYTLFFLLVFSCFDYHCNIFFLHFKFIQLIRSGDIEIQPGPIKNALKFCHWNLNSVLAHDRIKISLLEAYNSVYNYDILVLGETYLSGDISHE